MECNKVWYKLHVLDRGEKEFRSDDTTPEPSGDDGGCGFDGDDDDEDDTGGSG